MPSRRNLERARKTLSDALSANEGAPYVTVYLARAQARELLALADAALASDTPTTRPDAR